MGLIRLTGCGHTCNVLGVATPAESTQEDDMTADTNARLIAQNKAANALADSIDTSRTTTVTADQIKPGDILTKLGKVTFPHPVIIGRANKIGTFGVQLFGTNGWFTPGPVRFAETATRVLRINEV